MSLAYNMKEQLAKRLQADLGLRFNAVVASSQSPSGYPVLVASIGGTAVASVMIRPRSFSGFNVVAELSASAAEGLPEHVAYTLIQTAADDVLKMKVFGAIVQMGISSTKIGIVADPSAAVFENEALYTDEFVNSARLGAIGQ